VSDLLRGVHDLLDGAVSVPDGDRAEGGLRHHKAVAAHQTEDPGEQPEGAAAIVGVHQDKLQAAVMENRPP